MSLIIDNKPVLLKSISHYVKTTFDPKLIYGQVFQMRLFMNNGFEWYILDYDEGAETAIGLINQADPKNAAIGQIELKLLDSLLNVSVDPHYVPENISQLFNRLVHSN